MSDPYHDMVRAIERLHRRFLDVIRSELHRRAITDINAVQALLLYNVGHDDVVMRDLKDRGYYFGSNVSYNVRKLTDAGYIDQQRDPHDRRAVRLRLSEKGLGLRDMLKAMQADIADSLASHNLQTERLVAIGQDLRTLDRVWSGLIGREDA